MLGRDGKRYQVNTTSRCVHRWLPCPNSRECIEATLIHVHVPFDIHANVSEALSHITSAMRNVANGPARVLHDVDIVLHLQSMRYGVYGYAQVKDLDECIKTINLRMAAENG